MHKPEVQRVRPSLPIHFNFGGNLQHNRAMDRKPRQAPLIEEDDGMYSKVFSSMYDGTLASKGPWQALVVFQQLLVLADAHGTVDMTPVALSRRTTIPLDIIEVGIAALERPDPDSRRSVEEGRRIVRIDPARNWGWRIVNYVFYHREMRNEEARREYQKKLMRDRRANEKRKQINGENAVSHDVSNALAPVRNVSQKLAHTDTDADVKTTPFASNEKISFDAEGGFQGITDNDRKTWQDAYPGIDLKAELAKAKAWALANPKNRKRNWRRFLNNWFARSQERARPVDVAPTVDEARAARSRSAIV